MARSLTDTLLAGGPFAREVAPYALLEVAGPDAGDFLQRLCSQDVLGLADQQVAPAAFLDGKGKVLATCLVFRIDGSFWLETQVEQVERLAALLDRYHFAEKLTIARRDLGPCEEWILRLSNVPAQDDRAQWIEGAGRVMWVSMQRRGVGFVRVHGGRMSQVEQQDEGRERPIVAQELPADLAECLRMAAGLVKVGVETEASTLALEADLDDHCSTTKGCYTGQEIVARIHTYGHVNRKLCLLRLPDGPELTAPVPLLEPDDQLAVGRVLHAVPCAALGLRVGLGYLPKDFQAVGTKLQLEGGGGEVVVAGW